MSSTPSPSEPRPDIAGDLRLVIGRLVRRVREETPPHELTWPQISVLGRLDREGPATVTQLARFEGVRSQSMGATVAALVEAGFVVTDTDPDDRRAIRVSLSPAGRDVVLVGRAARTDWLNRTIRERLSPAEQTRLAEAVSLLKRLVD